MTGHQDTPARSADTMSDAIALSSPGGRMSKRARAAATRKLGVALFGTGGNLLSPPTPQPTRQEALLAQAKRLRDLADRGMSTRKYRREADRLETLARAEAGEPKGGSA